MTHPEQPFVIIGETNFEALYPTADAQALEAAWREHCGTPKDSYTQTDLVLGVLQQRRVPPSVFVSVDLCEVVRGTHIGIRGFEEPLGTSVHREPYGRDMKIITSIKDENEELQTKRRIQCINDMARTLINADLIPPDPHTPGIAAFLRNWRRRGAFVFANTATGEGGEEGTVRFLGEHLPGAFDGIVFSRNYDATAPIKKGSVAREVVDSMGTKEASVIHIDDSHKHLETFADSFGPRSHTKFATFQARYPGLTQHADSPGSHSRLETFAIANEHIQKELARLAVGKATIDSKQTER